jgi:hypothetical protein
MLAIVLAVIVLGNGVYAHADTVTLELTGVGPGYNDGSYYVYPYVFSVNGAGSVSMVCDDFNDEIYMYETWQANVYTLAQVLSGTPGDGQMNVSSGSLATTRSQAYIDAAYLYQQLVLPANNDQTDAVNLNHTIWALFAGDTGYNSDAGVQYWFTQAQTYAAAAYASGSLNNVDFYTPVAGTQPSGDGTPQEFIGTSVPEPTSLALLGVGLIGLGVISRKRRFQA